MPDPRLPARLDPGSRSLARKAGYSLSAAVIVSVLAYTGWWFMVAGRAEGEIQRWVDAQRLEGLDIVHAPLVMTGYPSRISATSETATVRTTGPDGEATVITLRDIVARARPWSADRVDFSAAGSVALNPDGVQARPAVDLAIEAMAGSVRLADGRPQAMELRARGISGWARPATRAGRESAPVDLTIEGMATVARFEETADALAMALDFAMEGFAVPTQLAQGALGNRIERIDVNFLISPYLDPQTLQGSQREQIAVWQAAGGVVDIRNISLSTGPLRVAISGPVQLDEALQPLAEALIRVHGVEEMLRSGEAAGTIDRGTVQFLRAIAAAARSNGDAPVDGAIEIPVRIERGGVFVGLLRVADLPPVTWE